MEMNNITLRGQIVGAKCVKHMELVVSGGFLLLSRPSYNMLSFHGARFGPLPGDTHAVLREDTVRPTGGNRVV